jgi:copper chaperone CopZ
MLGFSSQIPPPPIGVPMSRADQTHETRQYTVEGMTCAHCVMCVREEVSEVAGVRAVDVDLASGRLTVTGENLKRRAIGAAVEDAGYEVVA